MGRSAPEQIPEPLLEGSVPLVLAALEERLRARMELNVRWALTIAIMRMAGFTRSEIHAKLRISDDDYARAWHLLRKVA